MQKLLNYPSIGLGILLILCIIYSSVISNQRDKALSNLESANSQILELVEINKNLNWVIDIQAQQLSSNNAYISDLENKRKLSEQKATQAQQSFRKAKHENQTINDWANQPLPFGLL